MKAVFNKLCMVLPLMCIGAAAVVVPFCMLSILFGAKINHQRENLFHTHRDAGQVHDPTTQQISDDALSEFDLKKILTRHYRKSRRKFALFSVIFTILA